MKLLQIPKFSKLKLRRPRKQPPQKLQARTRAADPAMLDYEEEEPQTKLTSAFIVVFILHVVAIGGIYAFNQIKASRRLPDPAPAVAPAAAATAPKTAAAAQVESDHAILAKTTTATVAATAESKPAPTAPLAPVLKQRVYNVKPNDTLHGIAKTFNVPVADLKAANGLSSDVIRPGQVLNLPAAHAGNTEAPAAPVTTAAAAPAKTQAASEAKPTMKTYTVKSGDRLVFIAKKFSVSQEDIMAANKIKDATKLQIGQTLKIPVKK